MGGGSGPHQRWATPEAPEPGMQLSLQDPRIGGRELGRRPAGTPNCGVAQRYSSVSASGGNSRPAKFSLMPARLSNAAPKPALPSNQVTKKAAPQMRVPATGTQPKSAQASHRQPSAPSPTSK